jgi:hypothetical protein
LYNADIGSLSARQRLVPGDDQLSLGEIQVSVSRMSPPALQKLSNCGDQPIELDWFGVKLVAPSSERFFTLAGQRVCRECNNRDISGLRIIP